MHKHSSGFNSLAVVIRPPPPASPQSPEAFFHHPQSNSTDTYDTTKTTSHHHHQHHPFYRHEDEDHEDDSYESQLLPLVGPASNDWSTSIYDCTNRSVILNCERDDDDWLILTSNHHEDLQQQQQQRNIATQQHAVLPKRVSLDVVSCDMWLWNHQHHPIMELDDLSFLDGEEGGEGVDDIISMDDDKNKNMHHEDYDNNDELHHDTDDTDYDDDDNETNIDEYTHRKWLEHRRRLQICMQKSEESRQKIIVSQATFQPQLHPSFAAFTQTHQSMLTVQDKVFFLGCTMNDDQRGIVDTDHRTGK